ncbi:MAG: tyrosine-type recombinase/integrase [Tepidisphaeraceae bacterium]
MPSVDDLKVIRPKAGGSSRRAEPDPVAARRRRDDDQRAAGPLPQGPRAQRPEEVDAPQRRRQHPHPHRPVLRHTSDPGYYDLGRDRSRRSPGGQGARAQDGPQRDRDAVRDAQLCQGTAAPLGAEQPRRRRRAAGRTEPQEIRYLTLPEIQRLLDHVRPGMFHEIDYGLYKAAVTTGMRLGELVALRWRDVDWNAGRIRVRGNYTCGEFGTPKTRRSTRSIPMIPDLAAPPRPPRAHPLAWPRRPRLRPPHITGDVLPKANITRRMAITCSCTRTTRRASGKARWWRRRSGVRPERTSW